MSLLALLMGAVLSGSTVIEYGHQPLDINLVQQVPTQEDKPFLEGQASRYDYQLGGNRWSKTHNTCAMRTGERYQIYKVCSKVTGKCVKCKLNDHGPAEYTHRVIDLSSHAFKELGIPLSRGVTEVKIYLDK